MGWLTSLARSLSWSRGATLLVHMCTERIAMPLASMTVPYFPVSSQRSLYRVPAAFAGLACAVAGFESVLMHAPPSPHAA